MDLGAHVQLVISDNSSDVTGVEIAGALKNVLAIAAGIVEGMNLGNNSMAALVTQGCSEIRWLATKVLDCCINFLCYSTLITKTVCLVFFFQEIIMKMLDLVSYVNYYMGC